MQMLRLIPPLWNNMNIQIERLVRHQLKFAAFEQALFHHLACGSRNDGFIACLHMTAGLKPSKQLCVMDQQQRRAIR